MKVMLDNNIVLDALRPNPEFEAEAKQIFYLIWQDKITPYMCANSLTDIFYILKKVQGADKAKDTLGNLMTAVNIVSVTAEDCRNALALPMNDFEDALIAVCAEKTGVDNIVSRDRKFIGAGTAVEVVAPSQLIEKIF